MKQLTSLGWTRRLDKAMITGFEKRLSHAIAILNLLSCTLCVWKDRFFLSKSAFDNGKKEMN